MPYYDAPDSPDENIFIFEETRDYCTAESAESRPLPIKAATRTGMLAFLTTYKPLAAARTDALAERVGEVNESVAAKQLLEINARDYIEGLKRRTRRLGHNAQVLVSHGLPESGDTPGMDNWADLKAVAQQLIAGDAASSTEYGAMSNPTSSELADALVAAQDEHDDIAPADTALQNAQSALEAQRATAEFWVSEIRLDALDFARREDAAGQRRLLRKLGFKFKTLPGETPEDPGDLPPPPTP